MSTNRNIVMATCFILTWISCGDQTPQEKHISELHARVMVIHDEMMPQMKDIYKLRKSLKGSELAQADTLIERLDEAEEAMMSWMAQYQKPKASDPDYAAYMDQQWISVQKMRDVMKEAIQMAKEALP